MIKVSQIGLGPIGTKIFSLVQNYSKIEFVGLFDKSPLLIGTSLGNKEIKPIEEIESIVPEQSLVIVTTTSSIKESMPLFQRLIKHKVNIISTCEELFFPFLSNPEEAHLLDSLAKDNNVKILGTGINPGFLMDTLPLFLSALHHKITSIEIERIQNASTRRAPFQKKIGYGLTMEEFNNGVAQKTIRHVGLRESHDFLNHYLNLEVNEIEESIGPIKNDKQILGVTQTISGLKDGTPKVKLTFNASIGEKKPRDRIIIEGTPGLEMTISNAVQGDEGTAAVIMNTIPSLLNSTAGLKTMADLIIPHKW
ncbi:MAG: hypothetical protein OEY33_08875 [Bdellovibrionales bacterium]|jgi:hypothetical protein|nr:hypothetical protein [Bdellovibrionales bacterium]